MERSIESRRRARALALVTTLLAGCQGTLDLVLPPPPADARSMILALDLVAGARGAIRELFAADVGTVLDVPRRVEDGEAVHVLYYRRTLDELGIARGPFLTTPAVEGGRRLAPADVAYEAHVDGRSASDWRILRPDEVPEIRVPGVPPLACLERGGCVADEPGLCLSRCEPTAPSPPELPEPVRPINPVTWTCPPGWQELSIEDHPGAAECAPVLPTECPFGQIQIPGDPGCRRLGDVCPLGQYRDALPSDVPSTAPRIYVRSGAVGGDGSIQSPFGRVDDAIAAAPPGAVVLLGAGAFDGDVRVANEVSIVGACAPETRLTGHVVVRGVARMDGVEAAGAIAIEAGGELTLRSTIVGGGPACLTIVGPGRLVASEVNIGACEIGVELAAGAVATLEGVAFVSTSSVGVHANDASVTVAEGAFLIGMNAAGIVASGGDLTVRRSALSGAPGSIGVSIADVHATMEDVVARDLASPVRASSGAALHLAGASLRSASPTQLVFDDATVAMTDVVVLGSAPVVGLVRATGGRLTLTRAVLDAVGSALSLETSAELEDLSVRVRCATSHCAGSGMTATGELQVARLAFHGEGGGIAMSDLTGPSVLADLSIDIDGAATTEALSISRADASVIRAHVEARGGADGVVARSSDVVLESLRASASQTAVLLSDDRRIVVARSILTSSGGDCVINSLGEDLRISDTTFDGCQESALLLGRGPVRLERVAVLGAGKQAMRVAPIDDPFGSTVVTADDLRVTGGQGGLMSGSKVQLVLERFVVEGLAGVALSMREGSPRLVDGLIEGNAKRFELGDAELLSEDVVRVWAPNNPPAPP